MQPAGYRTFEQKCALLTHLKTFISPNKNRLFEKNVRERTRHITVVLEDIYQPHNASAVLRSCDCFGIQDVHIIENKNRYNVNPDVALGSSKWLTLYNYNQKDNNTLECLNELKAKGYRLVATTPRSNGQRLGEIRVDDKLALLFGTELEGLSDIALDNSEEFLYIPMFGFTESLNISVSAAIILHILSLRIRELDIDWGLSKEEVVDVQIDWARNTLKNSHLIEKEFFARK